MKVNRRCLFAVVLLMIVPLAKAATVTIDSDGMAVVNGKRTLILGLYENPTDDIALHEAANAGFNLIRSDSSLEALDRLQKAGVLAWLNTGYAIDLSANTDVHSQALTKMAADFGAHPALGVWEVPDEALWNTWYMPQQWRWGAEPRQLREAIAKVEEETQRSALMSQLQESIALREAGEYAASEDAADALWRALGQEPPQPESRVSTAKERSHIMAEGMLKGYRHLREADPTHPVWMNHAPRNQIDQLARFNHAADIVGCDIYPVPFGQTGHSDVADRGLSSVGAYTDRMQAAAPAKPVWMVLQGCSWGDFGNNSEERLRLLHRPRIEETRFMAYDAIVHGARGVLYWGTSYVEKDSEFWKQLLTVIGEMKALQPILSATDAKQQPRISYEETYGSVDVGPLVLAKQTEKGDALVLVNEWTSPLRVSVEGIANPTSVYEDTYSGRRYTIEDGRLTLMMPRYGVAVLLPVP